MVRALMSAGHDVYDFRNPKKGDHGFSWSQIDPDWTLWSDSEFRDGLQHPLAESGFKLDMEALHWCDVCVHVVPSTAGRSSHLELGWASGAGKLCIILLGCSEPELMYKMAHHICVTIDEVLECIASHK